MMATGYADVPCPECGSVVRFDEQIADLKLKLTRALQTNQEVEAENVELRAQLAELREKAREWADSEYDCPLRDLIRETVAPRGKEGEG